MIGSWLALLAYFSAVSLGHLAFSTWLVQPRSGPFGAYSLQEFVPLVMLLAGTALLVWLVVVLRRSRHRTRWVLFWLLWFLSVALVDRYLTYSANEYAHYPQYAILAWLVGRVLDPQRSKQALGRVVFWTSVLGMLDETQQYLWLAPSYGGYLDFNDFLVNLLAAAAGAMLYYGDRWVLGPMQTIRSTQREIALVATLVAAIGLGLAAGRLHLSTQMTVPPGGIVTDAKGTLRLYLERRPGAYGAWAKGPYRGRYWVLSPLQGAALLLIAAGLFGWILPAASARPDRPMVSPADG